MVKRVLAPSAREIHLVHSENRYLKLRLRDIEEQWAAIARFLTRCTDATLPPRDATLHLVVEPRSARALSSAIARARKLFGKPDVEKSDEDTSYQWEIHARFFGTAISYIASGQPWHYDVVPTPALDFMPFFRLRDPVSGKLLPGQSRPPRKWVGQFASMLYASLGPDAFGWFDLRLPFDAVDDKLLNFLHHFAQELPFQLPVNRLRHAGVGKVSGTFRYAPLAPDELAALKTAVRR
jgi:hypothetical protein